MLFTNTLATWRLTRLLHNERGPYALLDRLRDIAGVEYTSSGAPYGTNELAKALCCLWCLSVWVGLVIALVTRRAWVEAFAYSAGALLIEEGLKRHGMG